MIMLAGRLARPLWAACSSTKTTVVIVAAFILLSVAGAMLPQSGATLPAESEAWKTQNPTIASLAETLGLFDAFTSYLFVGLLTALALNMVACTARRTYYSRRASGGARVALLGSLALHVGLLVVLAGGVVTAATSIDGRVVLTEGQVVDLSREGDYLSLRRGVWARGELPRSVLGSESSRPAPGDAYATQIETMLAIGREGEETISRELAVNRPVRADDVVLTHADWGFSPLMTVVSPRGEVVINAYVALASVHGGAGVYEDVVEGPGLPGIVRVRLLPDLRLSGGEPISASPEPRNPALWIEVLDEEGAAVDAGLATFGAEASVAGYNFTFGDLRRWTAVRVRADSGRLVVYAGFVVGLLGLLVRYAPALVAFGRGKRPPTGEVTV